MKSKNTMNIPPVWTFDDDSVVDNFDKHVREQLPWYDMVSSAIAQIGNHYIPVGGVVYDIGASTGNVEKVLLDTLLCRNVQFIPVEKSSNMAAKYGGNYEVVCEDVTEFTFEPFDFAVCFLSMMFIPPHKRVELVKSMMYNLRDGGAIAIVEKTVPSGGYVSTVLSRLTLREKLNNGVSPADILAKELSLSGVQRPIDPVTLFANYKYTEFFRYGEFGGYILENP
jgi:tRNA (cmo5U34)-methyltransferase